MLTSFGSEARDVDPDLEGLDVKLVPLTDGEFYHFGSNRDLISSSLKLQNRVTDQRLKFTRESDHHPSIFQQNSKVGFQFTAGNQDIWIENSLMFPFPGNWAEITSSPGCLKMNGSWNFPMASAWMWFICHVGAFVCGLYGFDDGFRDSMEDGVIWMGRTLKEWLDDRAIEAGAAGMNSKDSIFESSAFPGS